MNLSEHQTRELVAGCVNNSRAAQEALYKLFYADMLRVCHSYLPDKELAKEAFNTGFLKVFKSIGKFDAGKGELGGWIRKIMIYTSIDLCRKELKFNAMSLLDNDQDEDEISIPASAVEKLYYEDILALIRTLPYATQTVFNLYEMDGFSHKEIADQLNISEGTSRWHLAEAKKKLRMLLDTPPNSNNVKERSGKAI